MLEKYTGLKQKHESKLEARKIAKAQYEAALKEIDEEFGDTEAALEEERGNILKWAKENNMKTHFERNGSFEIRRSPPKYVVKNELQLKVELAMKGHYEALELKKAQVNNLARDGILPASLVETLIDEQIAITVTYPKE